jgi:ribosomal protein S18 acetylase RimI-like enzyme
VTTIERVSLSPRALELDDGTTFERWTEEEREDAVTIVAEDREGLVVGRVHIARRPGREAADFSVWTAPHLRGRGIGGQLLADGLAWAAKHDVPFLLAEVPASDTSVRAFLTSRSLVVSSRTCGGTSTLAVLVPGRSGNAALDAA